MEFCELLSINSPSLNWLTSFYKLLVARQFLQDPCFDQVNTPRFEMTTFLSQDNQGNICLNLVVECSLLEKDDSKPTMLILLSLKLPKED